MPRDSALTDEHNLTEQRAALNALVTARARAMKALNVEVAEAARDLIRSAFQQHLPEAKTLRIVSGGYEQVTGLGGAYRADGTRVTDLPEALWEYETLVSMLGRDASVLDQVLIRTRHSDFWTIAL